ncbi:tigger transposable element-derived protein 4-like [Argopecten irradians]|uniref:tigger transposable element-derived protein 4-like n=1 Tax=Argopecten irradians TaxID=31199 RepID=UPI00372153E5
MASKRTELNLQQRVEVVKRLNSGETATKIAKDFHVGRTQIQNIKKRKAEILQDYEIHGPSPKRKRHVTGNEDINNLCLTWFKDAMARRIVISGPLIQARALKYAQELNITTFKASNGWLESFVKRNNIVFGSQSGERGDVNIDVIDDWNDRLQSMCEGFDPKDIFNIDESGIFFRDTTKKTLYISR